MKTFLVFEPANGGRDADSADRVQFVREKFYWSAFFLAPLWLLWHRLWIEAVAVFAVLFAASALERVGWLAMAVPLLSLLVSTFIGYIFAVPFSFIAARNLTPHPVLRLVVKRFMELLRAFPGRSMSTRLWAESSAAAQARDGVSTLFVGDGDWASAWASASGLPQGARQRELALRFGVNLVMVALTGNYKADQVHVPALLERMGRER